MDIKAVSNIDVEIDVEWHSEIPKSRLMHELQ